MFSFSWKTLLIVFQILCHHFTTDSLKQILEMITTAVWMVYRNDISNAKLFLKLFICLFFECGSKRTYSIPKLSFYSEIYDKRQIVDEWGKGEYGLSVTAKSVKRYALIKTTASEITLQHLVFHGGKAATLAPLMLLLLHFLHHHLLFHRSLLAVAFWLWLIFRHQRKSIIACLSLSVLLFIFSAASTLALASTL